MSTSPPSGPTAAEASPGQETVLARRVLHAQDAASLGTWDYDLVSNIVTWDAHAAALAGLDLADFGGTVEAFLDVVHPDDRERILLALMASVNDGSPFDEQYRVVLPDRTVRSVLIRGKALRSVGGAVSRLVGACVDVTDVHRAGRALERGRHADSVALLTSLQRSLLTEPPQPDHIEVAVRYAAAADGARIGGDWYDALVTPDGALVVTIGDCVGHDQAAAVSMASVRNLLRATAFTVEGTPSVVLTQLERILVGLNVDALATAVLGRIEQPGELQELRLRRLVWSNAGHLPPVLLHEGRAQLLTTDDPDLLLGMNTGLRRRDHDVLLPIGSTLLLYTDGLVEVRGEHLDVGLERLRVLLQELADQPLELLCDTLLARLLPPEGAEDDVALLALRMHDESRRRPPPAGPEPTADLRPRGHWTPLEQRTPPAR